MTHTHSGAFEQASVGLPGLADAFAPAFQWRFLSRFVLRSPGFAFSTLAPLRCTRAHLCALQSQADSPQQRTEFQEEAERGRGELLRLAADPAVQEALFLSSPDFLQNNLGKYLRLASAGVRNSEVRRIERRLFSYLQRLVAKNETTSAFGPLNYGSFGAGRQDAAVDLAYADGPLIQRREVFMSFWAVKALAQAISGDLDLQPGLPLRLHPMASILPGIGLQLRPGGRVLSLAPGVLQALAGVDGRRSASQIEALCPPVDRPALHRLLAALVDKGVLVRGPFVASSELHLLERLYTDVAALSPSEARDRRLTMLDAWLQWCRAMEDAPLTQRMDLVARGQERFTSETGLPAQRGQGEMYADRTIYYEESLGNVERLNFSAQTHAAMAERMQGALDLCAAAGEFEWAQLRALGADCFRTLSPAGLPVPLEDFVAAVNARHATVPALAPAPVVQRLQAQVRRLVEAGTVSVAEIDSRSLAIPEVARSLYSLPDMFISAESEQALTEGRFELFLGKLHHHLLLPSWLTTFVDDEAALVHDLQQALAAPGLESLVGMEILRRNKGFYSFVGPRVIVAEEPAADRPGSRLPLRDMEVLLDADGELMLRAPDREGLHLYLSLADHMRYLPFAMLAWPWLAQVEVDLGPHTPRVVVDGVVIQRERWVLPASGLQATRSDDEFVAFRRMVRWAALHGLPEQVYARGAERKPVFIDFTIPQCHAHLRSLAEGTTDLRFEEMYPAPQGLWLNRARGGYTSEMRACVLKLPATHLV
jgi:hypothetical protein